MYKNLCILKKKNNKIAQNTLKNKVFHNKILI